MFTSQQAGAFYHNGGMLGAFTQPEAILAELPVGTYVLNCHPEKGFYLSITSDFTLPNKVYGNNNNYTQTILNTFMNTRPNKITSVVLSGLKGSGKTLTAKQISIEGAKLGIPTVIVNSSFTGNGFTSFLMHIKKPFILFIDEFEKVYNDENDLNALLTMLDGTVNAHMLCVMTMNSSLNDDRFKFFKNRPGRVYYNIHYPTCTEEVIREYLEENLDNKDDIEKVVNFTYRFNDFTLDLLTTLVTEYNNSPVKDLIELTDILNIKPDANLTDDFYDVSLVLPSGAVLEKYELYGSGFELNTSFLKSLLSYQQTNIEYRVAYGDPMFNYIKENYEALQTYMNVSAYDLDDLSGYRVDSNPRLKKLYNETPEDQHYNVIGEYRLNWYFSLLEIERKTNRSFTLAVDYSLRLLELTNKEIGFKIQVRGKRPTKASKIFLL